MVTIADAMIEVPAFLSWRFIFPIHLLTKSELQTLALIRQVAQENLWPRALTHYQTGAFPTEAYRDLADADMLGLTIPVEYGGKGFSPMGFAAAMLELGQGDPSVANTVNMHLVICWFLRVLAKIRQSEYFFPLVVRDGVCFAASTSEDGVEWADPQGTVLNTTIRRLTTRKYILNGKKWRTSMANTASHYCVAAVLEGYATREGLLIAMVPRDTSGITVLNDWPGPMMWSTDSCSLEFKDCVIPATHVIGKRGELPASGLFPLFSLGYAALYLGIGLSAFLSFMREYGSKELDATIGEMALEFHRALVILGQAAMAWQDNDERRIPVATAHAKGYCPQVTYRILQQINTIVGEDKNPYHRLLVDSKAAQFMPPNPCLVASRIGEALRLGTDPQFLAFRSGNT